MRTFSLDLDTGLSEEVFTGCIALHFADECACASSLAFSPSTVFLFRMTNLSMSDDNLIMSRPTTNGTET